MRYLAICVLAILAGCAGMQTAAMLHIEYMTPQDAPAAPAVAPAPKGKRL